MKQIPERVLVGPDTWLDVTEKNLGGARLGCTNCRGIEIESEQPDIGKHSILLHELIHVAAEKMKMAGICKRQPSEEYVTNLAGTLFIMLAGSGLWSGITHEEAMKWASEV